MSAYYGQAAFIRQKRAFKGGGEIVNSISWKEPQPRRTFTIPQHFFTGEREPTFVFSRVCRRTLVVAVHLMPDNDEPAPRNHGSRYTNNPSRQCGIVSPRCNNRGRIIVNSKSRVTRPLASSNSCFLLLQRYPAIEFKI